MNVLVACEESQAVCKAFREKGHNAFSCDVIECSGGHPEWHIQDDVLPLLDGDCIFTTSDGVDRYISGKWDLIIAFPPCTHLAVSGARHFEKKRADGRQREGIEFFAQFLTADCEKIAIENPVGIISGEYIPKHFPDPSKRMPHEIFVQLNERLLKEKEEVRQALCKAYEAMPEPINYEEKIAKFTDALNALKDPNVDVARKNALLKACIERIEYSRERPQRLTREEAEKRGIPLQVGGKWTDTPIEIDVKLKV